MMQHYTIYNQTSGAPFGEAVADSLEAALDMIARDAGYADFADLCEVIGETKDEAIADLAITAEPVILLVDGGLAATNDSPPTTLGALGQYIDATAESMRDADGPDSILDWNVLPVGLDGLGFADSYDVTFRWRDAAGAIIESNEPLLTLRPIRCDRDATAIVWARHTVQAGQLPTVTDIDERGEDSDDFVALRCDAATLAALIKAAESYPATYERRAVRSILKTLKAR